MIVFPPQSDAGELLNSNLQLRKLCQSHVKLE